MVLVLSGFAVGYFGDLNRRLNDEIEDRRLAETDLRNLDTRLALVADVARSMRTEQPVPSIIDNAVEALHRRFPALRVAYSTVNREGRITIECARGPHDLEWPAAVETELALPADCVPTLSEGTLIVVNDVNHDVAARGLAAALAAGGARAFIDAPIEHSDDLVGLLSFDSPTPHTWDAHETMTLKEVADMLAVAIRDSHSRQQLVESELKFRTLATSSHYAIAMVQPQGFVFFNPAFEEMTGYSSTELKQLDPLELGPSMPATRSRPPSPSASPARRCRRMPKRK